MNFQALQKEIGLAAKQAFLQLKEKYPDEKFCGYALYSDTGANTICPSANTVAHLNANIANDPDDEEYYRWSPSEWAYECEEAEIFSGISQSLIKELNSIASSDERDFFKRQVYESCVSALEGLAREGFFDSIAVFPVIVFSISGSVNECESDWISRLNTAEMASQFNNWASN